MSVALRMRATWPRIAAKWSSARWFHQTRPVLAGRGKTLAQLPWSEQEFVRIAPGYTKTPVQPEGKGEGEGEAESQQQPETEGSRKPSEMAKPRRHQRERPVPVRMTFAIPPGVTRDDFMHYMKDLYFKRSRKIDHVMPTALTILVTPRFTTWLDDVPFMTTLIRAITPNSGMHMTVLTGVVDNIAPVVRFGQPQEGFTMTLGHERDDTPPSLTFTSPPLDPEDLKVPPGRIRFVFKELDSYQYPVAVDVPLANTLFQNGREYTLNKSYWAGNPGFFSLGAQTPVSQTALIFQGRRPLEVARFRVDMGAEVCASFVALTKSRRITSCLGNIISEVQLEDGTAAPASTELETAVDVLRENRSQWGHQNTEGIEQDASATDPSTSKAVKEPGQPEPPTQIWALVAPPSILPFTKEFNTLEKALFGLEIYSGDPSMERKVAKYNQHLLRALFERGCQLHRVESGGGGWGSRRGRLALDPNPSGFGEVLGEDSSNMVLNDADAGEDGPPVLQKGLIAPGSWVRFLTPPQPPPPEELPTMPESPGIADPSEPSPPWGVPEDAVSPLQAADNTVRPGKPPRTFRLVTDGITPFPHTFLFGPSTTVDSEGGERPDAANRTADKIVLMRNHFGALSKQGVLLKSLIPTQNPDEPPKTALQRFLDTFDARSKKNVQWSLDNETLLALDLRLKKASTDMLYKLFGFRRFRRYVVAIKRGALMGEGVRQLLSFGRSHDELRARWQRVGPGEMTLGTKVDSPYSYVHIRADNARFAMRMDEMRSAESDRVAKEEMERKTLVRLRNKRLLLHKLYEPPLE